MILSSGTGWQRQTIALQSCSNKREALTAAKVVGRLVAAGVAASSIGIICFFRAQAKPCCVHEGFWGAPSESTFRAHC